MKAIKFLVISSLLILSKPVLAGSAVTDAQEQKQSATFSAQASASTAPAISNQIVPDVLPEVNGTETAADWLVKLKSALTKQNFDAGVISTKANKTDSFKWLHGVVSGTQVESIAPLIGGGMTTIRKGNVVSFIEANKQVFSIEASSIRNFIPPVFYKSVEVLADSYQFVSVSKNQIGGRPAQLIRIESKDNTTFNYWVWVDVESGLPLRLEYVNQSGEVVERMLMTHLSVFSKPTEDMQKLSALDFPEPAVIGLASNKDTNDWHMNWLPAGFKLIKSDRHHVSISREVSDYYLYSDGLVEFSIYIQRPLESFKSPIVLQDGATSFVMINANGFDVTVVGAIPAETGYQIATSITRK